MISMESTIPANAEDIIDLEDYNLQQDPDIYNMDVGPYGKEYHFFPSDKPEVLEEGAGPGPSMAVN